MTERITTLRRKTIVRPTVDVLSGLAGPGARAAWEQLAASGDGQPMKAVLRFLFAAVIIDKHRGKRSSFDYSRIEIEPNPLKPPLRRSPQVAKNPSQPGWVAVSMKPTHRTSSA